MEKVSVIIPAYNEADVLPRSIESVINQTYENWELIIVDDNSTDKTKSIINRYNDPRVKYYSHNQNLGGSAARNTGIEYSDGQYIALLDADDVWDQRKLEEQIKLLKNLGSEYVGVYCGVKLKQTNGRSLIPFTGQSNGDMTKNTDKITDPQRDVLMLNFSTGGCSSLLLRSNVVDSMDGFDEDFPRHQDIELLARLFNYGKLGKVNQILVTKYGHSNPNSNTVRASKDELLHKFRDTISSYESEGYHITKYHEFRMAKHYTQDGLFINSFHSLIKGKPSRKREYLVPVLQIPEGIRSLFKRKIK